MSDSCPVCGDDYIIGPGGRSHAECRKVQGRRRVRMTMQVEYVRLDEAIEWILSDDPSKGEPPALVSQLRAELLAIDAQHNAAYVVPPTSESE